MRKHDVIVACDFPDKGSTIKFLQKFSILDRKIFIKIGLELFCREGPSIVTELKKYADSIFLDLKLCDIPNTVRNAMNNIAQLDIDMVTIHAMGGSDMISAAKESLEHTNIRLLVVTLLTSISKEILNQELLIQQTPNEVVKQYALNSQQHGADGVISSCLEVDTIKKVCGENFIVVTPGIRYTNQKTNDDQKRIATPMQARKMGSDYIVVGRTITNSEDPVGKYIQVYQEFINHAIQ